MATFGLCITDWASAQQPSTWCAALLGEGAFITLTSHCGGYNILRVALVDIVATYYYDPQSGALVGTSAGSKEGWGCEGRGPPVESVPDCNGNGDVVIRSCGSDAAAGD